MTPFEEFRLWLREGAAFERVFGAIAAVVVLGLVGWVLVPSDDSNSVAVVATVAGSGSPQTTAVGSPGGPTATDTGASPSDSLPVNGPAAGSGRGVAPSGTVATSPKASGGTADPCANPTSTDQGVTATTVTIAVIRLDVAGGNAVLGVPPPDEQQRENQAIIDDINRNGGLLCRKIVPKYYTDNPLDSNSEHSVCLDIVAAKVFASIGALYTAANATCLPQNHIPTYGQTGGPTSLLKKFAPYLFTFYMDSDTDFRSYVVGAKQQGFFDGMHKLGVVTGDCYPEYNEQLFSALGRAGIASNKIETYDYDCPAGGVVPPSTVTQAVVQFQRDGVDRVMSAGANLASFSSAAQGQGYHPKYAVSDIDTTMTLSPSTGFAPDAQNFDGALDITNSQYGATNTPGVALSPETNNCNAKLTKGGAAWKAQDGDGYAGGTCNQWNMLLLGVKGSGALVRSGLAAGLNKTGYFYQSFPGAPSMWNDPLTPKDWSGPYWRPIRYKGSNNTWTVINAEWSSASI